METSRSRCMTRGARPRARLRRHGRSPPHYTQVGATLLFASEIKSLLAHPCVTTAPDEDSLAGLVLDKWDNGHHTGFKRIYSVPPGQMFLARPGSVELRRHWTFDPQTRNTLSNVDEYVECFGSLFEQAVRRRMRSVRPVAVAVSGGVDSSSVLCQAAALRRRDGSLPAVGGIAMTFPADTAAHEDPFLDDLDREVRICGQDQAPGCRTATDPRSPGNRGASGNADARLGSPWSGIRAGSPGELRGDP